MSEHAPLGPSAAERWLVCTASVRLSNEVAGYDDSRYAREGTLAHTRGEIEAKYLLMDRPELHPGGSSSILYDEECATWLEACKAEGLTDEQVADIEDHSRSYAQLLVDLRDEMGPGTVVFLEERVYPGVPQCWGTGDAILVSPTQVRIVDFKYGSGIRVEVNDNPQLKLYGLGALEGYGDLVGDTESVVVTIYQPRVSSDPSSQEWTPAALRQWRADVVLPRAAEALSEEGVFVPGEVQCRWCPAAGICRARMEAATAEDFSSDPDIIGDDELAEILERLPQIEAWAKAVRDVAFRKLHDMGHTVGTWKIVKTEGKRSIVDHPQAISRLIDAGYDSEAVSRRTAKTLGDLEKLVGKTKLPEILGETLKKGEGSKVLAPGDDPRPSYDPTSAAQADFKEEA